MQLFAKACKYGASFIVIDLFPNLRLLIWFRKKSYEVLIVIGYYKLQDHVNSTILVLNNWVNLCYVLVN
jgi:hypothetical protein